VSPRTPAERARMLRASAMFEAASLALRSIARGPEDRITKEARELEARARQASEGLRNLVLLDETAGAGG
jgi:hypothetical protein